MKNDQLRLPDYIDHMLQAIQRVRHYTEHLTEETFLQNEQVQDAVLRNIEIIGEAARNIVRSYPECIAQHSTIPWEDIYLMRNRICHGYFVSTWKLSGKR